MLRRLLGLGAKSPDEPAVGIPLLVWVRNDSPRATTETIFGGLPSVPSGFCWPKCAACEGKMQFLGQLRVGPRLMLLFMCQNDPGCCNEWDPDDGGNAVISVAPDALSLALAPVDGATTRNTRYGAKVVHFKAEDYNAARSGWAEASGCSPRMVLGHLDERPYWIQADQRPVCNSCIQPMKFVAQLETGPDYQSEMNFGGGGCAYLFNCDCADSSAKFLWQCRSKTRQPDWLKDADYHGAGRRRQLETVRSNESCPCSAPGR